MSDLIERLNAGIAVCDRRLPTARTQQDIEVALVFREILTETRDEIERLERELAEARGLLREASEEWIDPHAYDRVLPEFADKCRAFMARIDAFLTADVSHSSQNGAGLSRTVDAEQSPLDRMADNARELGLDYTPADQPSGANK